MEFNEKTVIITGASGGIGKATAKFFADEGANLTLVDLDENKLKEMVIELQLSEESYIIQEADVSKESEVKNMLMKP